MQKTVTIWRPTALVGGREPFFSSRADPEVDFPEDYSKVAAVSLPSHFPEWRVLETAWELTNSIDFPWTDNEEVSHNAPPPLRRPTYLPGGQELDEEAWRSRVPWRSSMVGDVFVLEDGTAHRVASFGFVRVEAATPLRDEA